MSHWVLPLASVAALAGFNATFIDSQNHYTTTRDSSSDIWPWRSYKTSPHHPPHLNVTRNETGLSNGYIFLSPADRRGKDGTYELSGTGFIMTTDGDMIYAAEERGYDFCHDWIAGMTDFRMQHYQGRPYITYWNGCNVHGAHWGHRWGQVTFIDEEYLNFTLNPRLGVNTLDEANRGQIDMHEHQMTLDDSILVTSYNNTLRDMTDIGGSNESWVADSMFFELDVATHEIIFQWSALDHVPLSESLWGFGGHRGSRQVPWDWFHINSVQKIGKNYLISARHLHSVLLISGDDGGILWKLSGLDGGTFGSIPARFRWQHHARAHNITGHGMTVSLFNNNVNGIKNNETQSEALAFYVPLPPDPDNPPQLVRKLSTPDEMIFAATQGSYQMDLGNGNGFVGYGKVPLLREYGPESDGQDLRWEAWFGYETAAMSYRAIKAEWRGTPKNWDPLALFEPSAGQENEWGHVYVSWIGATDVSHWAIFAGNSSQHLEPVGVAEKMGFETTFQLKDEELECVQVGAVRGHLIIRRSNIACKNDGPFIFDQPLSETSGGKLLAEIEDLQAELAHYESGMWLSQKLVATIVIAVIAVVSFFAGFSFWRDRRKARSPRGMLDEESPSRGHHRIGSGRGLDVFKWTMEKVKRSPMVTTDAATFEGMKMAEAATGREHGGLRVDERSMLTAANQEDEDSDDMESESDSRTRLIRHHS